MSDTFSFYQISRSVFACPVRGLFCCFISACSSCSLSTDGAPELWLTPLTCAHVNILWCLFRLSDTLSPPSESLCTLLGCTSPPPRNALDAVYHWLYWEHLMAQCDWFCEQLIYWSLSSAELWMLKKLPFPFKDHLLTKYFFSKVANGFRSAPQMTLRQ